MHWSRKRVHSKVLNSLVMSFASGRQNCVEGEEMCRVFEAGDDDDDDEDEEEEEEEEDDDDDDLVQNMDKGLLAASIIILQSRDIGMPASPWRAIMSMQN